MLSCLCHVPEVTESGALEVVGVVGRGGLKSSGPLGGRPRFFGSFMISRCEAVVVTGGVCCCGEVSLTVPATNCRDAPRYSAPRMKIT